MPTACVVACCLLSLHLKALMQASSALAAHRETQVAGLLQPPTGQLCARNGASEQHGLFQLQPLHNP